jgi:hypothetical protein
MVLAIGIDATKICEINFRTGEIYYFLKNFTFPYPQLFQIVPGGV